MQDSPCVLTKPSHLVSSAVIQTKVGKVVSVTLGNLTSSTSYTVAVTAVYNEDQSEPITGTFTTSKEPSSDSPISHSSPSAIAPVSPTYFELIRLVYVTLSFTSCYASNLGPLG